MTQKSGKADDPDPTPQTAKPSDAILEASTAPFIRMQHFHKFSVQAFIYNLTWPDFLSYWLTLLYRNFSISDSKLGVGLKLGYAIWLGDNRDANVTAQFSCNMYILLIKHRIFDQRLKYRDERKQ